MIIPNMEDVNIEMSLEMIPRRVHRQEAKNIAAQGINSTDPPTLNNQLALERENLDCETAEMTGENANPIENREAREPTSEGERNMDLNCCHQSCRYYPLYS